MSKILIVLGIWGLFASLIGIWTDRNLEFWLSYFKRQNVDVPFWMSFLLTLVLNAVIVAANVISEIVRLAFM